MRLHGSYLLLNTKELNGLVKQSQKMAKITLENKNTKFRIVSEADLLKKPKSYFKKRIVIMPSQKSKLFEKLDSWNVTMISSVATRNMELHLNEAISKGTNLKNFNKTWFKTPVFLKSMAFYGCIVGFDGFCEDIESDDRQELYFLKNDVMSLGGRVTKGMSMNILITKMFDKNSRKIKHAIKHHIPILKPTWVANAVEQADLMNAEFIVRRIETDFDSFIWQQNEDPVDDNNEEGDEDEHDNDDDNNDGNDDDDQVAMRHLEHHYFDGPSPPTPPPPPSPPAPPPPPPPPPPTRTRNRITVSTAAVTFPATCQNSDSIKEVKRLQQLLNNKLKKLTTSKSTEESKLAAIKVLQDLDNLKQFVQTEYIDE
uniref:BRCT domain-containing protein n=1 Tax=Panagrolaimus sp. JU765 TaxID=591449 RepID=A0AC34RGY4_9BILA